MFGNRKRIQELELQVESLTNELNAERQKQKRLQSEAQQRQQDALQGKEGYEQLRALYSQRLQDQAEAQAIHDEKLAFEAAEARKNLDEEIATTRKDSQDRLKSSIEAFSGSYLHYLDQIRLLFEMLNAAAIRTGSTLAFPEEKHIEDLFGEEMARALAAMSGVPEDADRLEAGADEEDKDAENSEE